MLASGPGGSLVPLSERVRGLLDRLRLDPKRSTLSRGLQSLLQFLVTLQPNHCLMTFHETDLGFPLLKPGPRPGGLRVRPRCGPGPGLTVVRMLAYATGRLRELRLTSGEQRESKDHVAGNGRAKTSSVMPH